MLKGLVYVLVTSAILYFYLRREFNHRFDLEDQLQAKVEQVQESKRELENSERWFRTAVEEAPLPMMLFTEQGDILALSRVWMEITGYSRDQLTTIDAWTELAYGSEKQPVRDGIATLFEHSQRVDEGEFTIRCKDGSERIWLFTATPLGRLVDHRRIVVSIAQDVTDYKQAQSMMLENERLRVGFQKEQEHNILVQRIITALSHDLRTPLASILASRETLAYYFDSLSPEKRRERLETIGHQVQFALELLEDTVNLARGSGEANSLRLATVNIDALCRVSVAEVGAARKSVDRLQYVNQSRLESAHVDEVLVSRILMNLLSNALKYSPDGEAVRLELDQHESWMVLRVIDHGIGISEADLPHVMEPFFRASSVAHSIHGTGLGLSIVKECVDRQQGKIDIQSAVGQGTTVTVELPLKAEQ
ncbi:MAG: PAS domain-containing sensor histidine kinase [Anaerolineae bacterium]